MISQEHGPICAAPWDSKKSTGFVGKCDLVATVVDMATGHVVPEGGILQIGQEKNGVFGGFDETLAFSGRLTGFNIWDGVLSNLRDKRGRRSRVLSHPG